MNSTTRASGSAMNREIIDSQDDRLSIHTHSIRLTQAHLPYQAVTGKRLSSEKHFSVYADQIILAGTLQNPGRDIELNAREIIIEKPAILDAAGAYADQDFAPGELPVQQDVKPGAAGTDGANGSTGGNSGNITICVQRLLDHIGASQPLLVMEIASLGGQIFSQQSPKVNDVIKLSRFEIAKNKMFGVINLENGHVEGLSNLQFESSGYDSSSQQISMQLNLPRLTISGTTNISGNTRMSSNAFACGIKLSALVTAGGKLDSLHAELSLISDAPIGLPVLLDIKFPAKFLASIKQHIISHLRTSAVEPLLSQFSKQLQAASLILLASGGRGGRGQDGHPGIQGEPGADGVKSSQSGVRTPGGNGFPEEAMGKDGRQGGRAGSPGLSGDGGQGGRIALNVIDALELGVMYSTAGGRGGVHANPGGRGPGGRGGRGAMTKMYDGKTGRPLDDMRATDGNQGPLGPEAKKTGINGQQGDAGIELQFNGKPFANASSAYYSFIELAQAISLSQLLITQNTTDLDFLNARNADDLRAVANGYGWLININQAFTDPKAVIDPKRISQPEQSVRAGMHNSTVVSLMRIQQGLDFYGHSYNWTPVLNLQNLITRTGQIISLGKVVEDQYHRYLDKSDNDKQRMQAFRQAKQEIDRKLDDFLVEMDKLKPQIESFESEVRDYTEDMRHQRGVLLEGQLEFRDELIKYLREENGLGFENFLDMLGTVIGCAGGVVGAVGGIKTAIDAVKKAEEFSKKVKNVVEVFKKAKATIDGISKAYSSIKDYIDEANPNAAKILVDAGDFDEMLKKYLGKFDAAGELRQAMDYYLELVQARNMAAYNYSTLVAQLLNLQVQHDQLYHSIQHINAEIASHQDNVLPIYTAYLSDAYEDVQRNLLRNIYLENRAYQYWSLQHRQLETSNLNIATQAAAHERLIADIDSFRENNESFSDFKQTLIISAERYPNEFAAMLQSRSLAFSLDIRDELGFLNMRFVIARKFKLEFPDIDSDKNVLYLNLIHSGRAVLNNNTDLDKPNAIHVFSHRPRVKLYKIDYSNRDNTAGGNFGEGGQGYIGLSPFSNWRIDFDLKGNEWLDLKTIKTVELTFSGRMLGPGRRFS